MPRSSRTYTSSSAHVVRDDDQFAVFDSQSAADTALTDMRGRAARYALGATLCGALAAALCIVIFIVLSPPDGEAEKSILTVLTFAILGALPPVGALAAAGALFNRGHVAGLWRPVPHVTAPLHITAKEIGEAIAALFTSSEQVQDPAMTAAAAKLSSGTPSEITDVLDGLPSDDAADLVAAFAFYVRSEDNGIAVRVSHPVEYDAAVAAARAMVTARASMPFPILDVSAQRLVQVADGTQRRAGATAITSPGAASRRERLSRLLVGDALSSQDYTSPVVHVAHDDGVFVAYDTPRDLRDALTRLRVEGSLRVLLGVLAGLFGVPVALWSLSHPGLIESPLASLGAAVGLSVTIIGCGYIAVSQVSRGVGSIWTPFQWVDAPLYVTAREIGQAVTVIERDSLLEVRLELVAPARGLGVGLVEMGGDYMVQPR